MKRTRRDYGTCPECGGQFLRWRTKVPQVTCGARKCIDSRVSRRRREERRAARELREGSAPLRIE